MSPQRLTHRKDHDRVKDGMLAKFFVAIIYGMLCFISKVCIIVHLNEVCMDEPECTIQ